MTETQLLLERYVHSGAEEAFAGLVERYLDLVYATALRRLDGDVQRARDVAQTVFIDLARKAPQLPPEVLLGGWLHRHACFVSTSLLRSERRRRRRETEAARRQALDHGLESPWLDIAPHLDEAINRLRRKDRAAILLRYFEGCSLEHVGAALGTSADAAQKRVARALDNLRRRLARQGFTLSAATLAAYLGCVNLGVAPAGWAAALSATALGSAAISTGWTLTLLETMTLTKLKTSGLCALLAAGIALPVFLHHHARELRRENASLRSQLETASARTDQLSAELQAFLGLKVDAHELARLRAGQTELLRLRSELGHLQRELAGRGPADGRSGPHSGSGGA